MLPRATRALVRRIPKSYPVAYQKLGRVISLERAERQHAAYVSALRNAGLEVSFVAADNRYPDCVFIEDTAVVWDDRVLMTRMGPVNEYEYLKREGEQTAVEDALRNTHRVSRMKPPATLEGGDVLHLDDVTHVGLSPQTNEAGARELSAFLGRRVVTTPISKCLHLKGAATYLGDGTLLVNSSLVNASAFMVDEFIEVHPKEDNVANCLRIGKHLLIPAGYPITERKLRRFAENHNLEVVSLDISEFEKGDGSLTCLSILW